MQLANPITVGDQTYDRLTINLAITTRATANGDDMSIALRAVPTAIAADGSVVTLDAAAKSVVRGTGTDLTEGERPAAAALLAAVTDFIASQGW